MPLPAGTSTAHWLLRIKGQPSEVPGPTDTELLVWIPLSAGEWARLAPALPPLGTRRPARLHPDFVAASRTADVAAEVAGLALDPAPFDKGPWHAAWAVWTGQHLVINLHSRQGLGD